MGRLLETFLYITICVSTISSNLWTEDWEDNNIIKHEQKPAYKNNEFCTDPEVCKSANKRMQSREELLTTNGASGVEEPILNYFPALFNKQPNYCSCGRKKRLIDLGPNYFPRYYPDMLCLPGGCGNFACSPKTFKFWVLKKRQEGDAKRGAEPVPLELRDHWTAENVVTTVECECRP